jgi:hypothetical protein
VVRVFRPTTAPYRPTLNTLGQGGCSVACAQVDQAFHPSGVDKLVSASASVKDARI